MTELRIGAAILREAIHTAEKEEDEGLKVRMAKVEEELRVKRVCSSFSREIISILWGFREALLFLGKGSVHRRPQGTDAPRGTRKKDPAPTGGDYARSVAHGVSGDVKKARRSVPGGHQKVTRVHMYLHLARTATNASHCGFKGQMYAITSHFVKFPAISVKIWWYRMNLPERDKG
jgi:hypothetical protein